MAIAIVVVILAALVAEVFRETAPAVAARRAGEEKHQDQHSRSREKQ